MRTFRTLPLAAVAALSLAACADAPTAPASPAAPRASYEASVRADRVAAVEWGKQGPELWIADGAGRRRVHFRYVRDFVEGNYPREYVEVTDATVRSIGPVKWSPDGRELAVVLGVGFDQSEIVVVNAEGGNQRVVSPNQTIVMTDVAWSADGTRIAYGLSTMPGGQAVDLVVSDVRDATVTRVTYGANLALPQFRWSADGGSLLVSTVRGARTVDSVFNRLSDVFRVEVATGAAAPVFSGVAGDPQAITAGGEMLTVRNLTPRGFAGERALVATDLSTGAERTLFAGGALRYAESLADDATVMLVANAGFDPSNWTQAFWTLPLAGGTPAPLAALGAQTISGDLFPAAAR